MGESNQRLTSQQKFWLFGVGLPALLVMVSLVLIVYRLNSTEHQLLGRWVIVSPSALRGNHLECLPYQLQSNGTPWLWSTIGDTLDTSRFEQPIFLGRMKQKLGFSSHVEEF
ncbi:MAG: hypothetical protein HUJ26_16545 [Planctomycetaceae bacterium]|nr:hypothetical protein [Planctomycetaceae bacterium]